MRVLVVSAHYPPNFVSGGTLAPQRIARGLRERGHEVSVYAGWLGEDRDALDAWSETGDDGVPVRWIVTTPWTAWSDRRNFDNPDVTADFRAHLRDVRPDVVHVHSVQTLGHGIVRAASEAGARVVVTMHDFWWICARQFLATRDYRPCSLVVSCGMCQCEVDRAWLDERNALLAESLAHADEVLAVSESAARVLLANGVAPDRLHVDENGLPALSARRVTPGDGGPVHFLYTGGADRMKGAAVVRSAAAELAGTPGWRLRAYGLRPTDDPLLLPEQVEMLDPFPPAAADAVFAWADVLIVPSIMRETHSLVTREALARGIPVIVTDTLGPEEVVADGDNGLVVPAADPAALADAMRSLVAEPALLARLRDGAAKGVPVRHIDEQVDALVGRFERLRNDAGGSPGAARARVRRVVRRVLFIVGIEGAPLRYRARFPAEGLEMLGVHTDVRHYRSSDVPALAAAADALVVYRVPATRQVISLIEAVRATGTPAFFDVDDLIFDPALAAEIPALTILPPDEAALWLEGVRRYRTTMEACDAFIGSTNALVRHAEQVVGIAAHRWANGAGLGPSRAGDSALANDRTPGPLRIGYLSGTNTHDHDWAYVEPAVERVLDRRDDVELWLGGLVQPSAALDRFGARVVRLPLVPWWDLPPILRDLDVNLAPLAPGSRFNDAKSAIKWLEAALTETPTVASPTEPFREAIDHGRNGFLASSPDEFEEAIVGLLDDRALRARVGARARRDVLLRWSPELQGRRYLEILEGGKLGRLRPPTWAEATVHDEPWALVDLEGYEPPDPARRGAPAPEAAPGKPFAVRAADFAERAVRTARREGLRSAAARAPGAIRSRVAHVRRVLADHAG